MKKVLHIGVILTFMLALVPAVGFAHMESDPFVTDLIAGGGNEASQMDVGDVLVWNDASNLYVRYVTTGGDWCITETHLAVATTIEEIPTTKKGNPIPGQFYYSSEYGLYPCEQDPDPYVIPLDGWTIGEDTSSPPFDTDEDGFDEVLAASN